LNWNSTVKPPGAIIKNKQTKQNSKVSRELTQNTPRTRKERRRNKREQNGHSRQNIDKEERKKHKGGRTSFSDFFFLYVF